MRGPPQRDCSLPPGKWLLKAETPSHCLSLPCCGSGSAAQAQRSLALPVRSVASLRLCCLSAVTSFMPVVLWQNSKSSRAIFAVILWDLKGVLFLFYLPLLPVQKFWWTIISFQITIPCIYIALSSELSALADTLWKYTRLRGAVGRSKPPGYDSRQGGELYTATKGVFLCYALSCQAARWADWGLCLPARLHRN